MAHRTGRFAPATEAELEMFKNKWRFWTLKEFKARMPTRGISFIAKHVHAERDNARHQRLVQPSEQPNGWVKGEYSNKTPDKLIDEILNS